MYVATLMARVSFENISWRELRMSNTLQHLIILAHINIYIYILLLPKLYLLSMHSVYLWTNK